MILTFLMFFKRIKNKIALALISVMILCFPVLKLRVRNHLLMMIYFGGLNGSSSSVNNDDDIFGGFYFFLKGCKAKCEGAESGTGDVLIFAHRRGMHTETIFNVVRQIAYIHGKESILFRDRERIQHLEETHIHSTPNSHCCIGQQGCWWQPFSFFLSSSLYMSHYSHICSLKSCLFYRHQWQLLLLLCQQWWLPNSIS